MSQPDPPARPDAGLRPSGPATVATAPVAAPPARTNTRGRAAVIAVLLVLAGLLTPVTLTAYWARTQVMDEGTYLATVAPLAKDPAIQSAVATRVSNSIIDAIDVEQVVANLLPARAEALAGPITLQVEAFVRRVVLQAVESEQFQRLWLPINKIAHESVVDIILGRRGQTLVEHGQLVIKVTDLIDQAKKRFGDTRLSFLQNIPTDKINQSFVLANVNQLEKYRHQAKLAVRLAWVLPFVLLGLIVAAIGISRNRRRTVLQAGIALAVGAAVLLVVVNVGRVLYLDKIPASSSEDAAAAVFDTIIRFLKNSARVTLLVGLIMVLVAVAFGPAGWAQRVRGVFNQAFASAGTRVGAKPSPALAWVARHVVALRAVIVAAAAVLLIWWTRPTPLVLILIFLVTLLLLAGLEVLARAGRAGLPEVDPLQSELVGSPAGSEWAPPDSAADPTDPGPGSVG